MSQYQRKPKPKPKGTLCTNNGCNERYTDETNGPEKCTYHPGAPIFHEGLKGWNCCKTRETNFEEFLNIPGCTTGPHQHVEKEKVSPHDCRETFVFYNSITLYTMYHFMLFFKHQML